MSLSLDLSPSVEARLRALAYRRDLSVSEFVKLLMERFGEESDSGAGGLDRENEGPDALWQAKALKEAQIENRELAVEAISDKNNLLAEVARAERERDELGRRGEKALHDGNRDLARSFFQEMQLREEVIQILHARHETAREAVEKLKALMVDQENAVRVWIAEERLAKVLEKHAQVLANVHRSLVEMERRPYLHFECDEEAERRFEEWASAQAAGAEAAAATNTENPTPPNEGDA